MQMVMISGESRSIPIMTMSYNQSRTSTQRGEETITATSKSFIDISSSKVPLKVNRVAPSEAAFLLPAERKNLKETMAVSVLRSSQHFKAIISMLTSLSPVRYSQPIYLSQLNSVNAKNC